MDWITGSAGQKAIRYIMVYMPNHIKNARSKNHDKT